MKTSTLHYRKKPYITHRYKRKIRLLLTNNCNRNCTFCHNEGMSHIENVLLDVDSIKKYYPYFKKITNRIVLSGGEPLLHPNLEKMIIDLSEYGFDITLDTATFILDKYYYLLHYIHDIHISFLDYENIDEFLYHINQLHINVPSLKIVINIPLLNEETAYIFFEKIFSLDVFDYLRFQIIQIFYKDRIITKNWFQRWEKIIDFFGYEKLKILDATEREISFITTKGMLVDFVDIPCEKAGNDFSRNTCLNEMDITITPNLCVQFCRWSNNTAVHLTKPQDFLKDLFCAFNKTENNCICGDIYNAFFDRGLKYESIAQHCIWPPENDSFLWKIRQQIKCSSTSYFGKEGYVHLFETEFARFTESKYALSFCSGAAAFFTACKAIGLNEQSKVILPVYSYPGIITALMLLQVTIILCDVDPETGNISLTEFNKLVQEDVDAVVITHLWGNLVDIPSIYKTCKKNNIKIIEDGSHAIGASVNGKKVGSIADVSFFSLQSNKVVYAGEGGILTTNDKILYEKAVMYSTLKKRIIDCVETKDFIKDDESGWGIKLKINPFGAIMAYESLLRVADVNKCRRNHNRVITNIISQCAIIESFQRDAIGERTFYTFKILLLEEYTAYRDKYVDALIKRGLDVTTSSFRPLHHLSITRSYHKIENSKKQYENADSYASRVISFPSFTYEEEEISKVYATIIVEEGNTILNSIKGEKT